MSFCDLYIEHFIMLRWIDVSDDIEVRSGDMYIGSMVDAILNECMSTHHSGMHGAAIAPLGGRRACINIL